MTIGMPHLCQKRRDGSDGVNAGFAGADAHDALDIGNEDLSVADTPRLSGVADGFDDRVHVFVCQNDFDFDLGKKVDDVFSAPVELRVTLLAPEALASVTVMPCRPTS